MTTKMLIIVALLIGIACAQPTLVVRAAGANVPSQRITLQNGFVVCPQDISNVGITVDCVAPQAIGTVNMQVNGVTVRQEGVEPYTMAGDISGVATAWNPPSGLVTVGCSTSNSGSASVSGQFTCAVTSTPTPTSTPSQSQTPSSVLIPSTTATATATSTPAESPAPSSASIPTSTSTATPTATPTPTSPSNSIPYMAVRAAGSNSAATLIRLNNGFSVCPADISTSGITLQCVAPGATGQVQMKLNGATFRTEGVAPYTMEGDSNGQSSAWNPPSGPITVGCSTNNIGMVTVSGAFECISAPSATPSTTPTMAPATTPSSAPSTGPGGTPPDTVLVPKIGAWTRVLPDYPVLAIEGQGGVIDGNLVALGGLTERYKNTTELCYAMTLTGPKQWRRLADMPSLYTHMGQTIQDQFLYGVGAYEGIDPKNYATADTWRYDLSKDKWDQLPSIPQPRGAGASAIVAGRFLVFAGGNIRSPQVSGVPADRADSWFLDLNNLQLGWRSQPPIPLARNHFSGITTCGRTFFVGGMKGENFKGGNVVDVEEFLPCGDGNGNKWVKRASLPYPLGHLGLSVLAYKCGIIVVGGGSNSATDGWGDHQSNILYYSPAVDRWDIIGNYQSTVMTPVCGIYNGNKLICTVGETRNKFSTEVFETTLTDELVMCDNACKAKFARINVEPAMNPNQVAQCFP